MLYHYQHHTESAYAVDLWYPYVPAGNQSEVFGRSGLHLNKVGTSRLARNFLDFLKNKD